MATNPRQAANTSYAPPSVIATGNPQLRIVGGTGHSNPHFGRGKGSDFVTDIAPYKADMDWENSGIKDVISFSDARANLNAVMDHVVQDRVQVVVTRQKAEAVVLVSLSDWNAMAETMHLVSTPANAARLQESIAQLEGGEGQERDLYPA